MMGEWLVILIVAVIVFTPKKIPQLAAHCAQLYRQVTIFKDYAAQLWQTEVHKQNLLDNTARAKVADEQYEKKLAE